MPQGLGKIFGQTTELGDLSKEVQRGFYLGPISWNDTSESEEQETNRFFEGEYKTKRKLKGATSYGLTIGWNEQDWFHMAFARNQFPKEAANVALPSHLTTRVPLTAPYEIVNPYLTDANNALYGIHPFITEEGAWGQPGGFTPASSAPNAGEVQLDNAGTKLVFNAAQAGAPLYIPVFTTYSTVQMIGGPGAAVKFGKFELWAEVYKAGVSQKILRHYPEVEIISESDITINNSINEVTIDLSVTIPSTHTNGLPYAEYNMGTAVL
ncbi:MAG: hypothetical protein AAGD09_11595 [Cyanobacteria bacterium P01_F01_bin.56]